MPGTMTGAMTGAGTGRWLITGGCGFIGVNLIARLKEGGEFAPFIRVLDDLSVGTRADLARVADFSEGLGSAGKEPAKGVELVTGSITDASLAMRAAEGMDVIVHLAANTGVQPSILDPRRDMEMNVGGTFNMLEAARVAFCRRFIFASSGAPAGEIEPPIHEEIAPHPVSPYGASKLAGEGYCSAYAKSFGLDTVALRFGNVYGPRSGHKSSVVAKFFRQALKGETLEIFGDGSQTRDFIHVGDLVGAILKAAATEGIGGEIFQIATHRETSVRELMELICDALEEAGKGRPKVVFGERLKGDVMRNFSDTTKARKRLGWQAGTALPEGLRSTLAWFLANGQ